MLPFALFLVPCYPKPMEITVILHDIRSVYNVGAILRSCDGFGVREAIFSGYTPIYDDPTLLPHLREKLNRKIEKTALGAEKTVKQKVVKNLGAFLDKKRKDGYVVIGLENNIDDARLIKLCDIHKRLAEIGNRSASQVISEKLPVNDFSETTPSDCEKNGSSGTTPSDCERSPMSNSRETISSNCEKVILLLGEEVSGIPKSLYDKIDLFAEIPMRGAKESFNVSVAAGVALYELRR